MLPGVPRPLIAVAAVVAAGLVARLIGERLPVWTRVLIIFAGAALGCLVLVPMLVA